MAKCTVHLDIDCGMNFIEPCENTGWTELDGFCPDHFREYLVVPAQINEYESARLVSTLQHRLYLVEAAMGLRSLPFEAKLPSGSATGRIKGVGQPNHRDVEDLEEME